MSARVVLVTLAAAALLTGCKEQTPIPRTPTTIRAISGMNQTGDLSAQLDSALVVEVVDAAGRPVANVPLAWSASSGGSIQPATTTTGADGRSSARWTLSPEPGRQIATVTSPQVVGASVAFTADNGAIVSGVVTAAGGSPYATFSMSPPRARRAYASPMRNARRLSIDRIIVGFKNDALGMAAAGTAAYRSMPTARQAVTAMRQRFTVLAQTLPVADAEFSPAMLAARVRVADPSDVDRVMSELRSRPDIAWVERDEIVTIRDGAPRPMSAELLGRFREIRTPGAVAGSAVATQLPNDPNVYAQLWPLSMMDLPRAWSITTGSASVIVAVVDQGIRFDHPDIASSLTNDGYDFVSQVGYGSPQEICDGGTFVTIDGDGDGPDPDPTAPDDLYWEPNLGCWVRETLGDHGLWTAGIIGSAGNDGVGLTGVNWNVKIRPIRALGITGEGTNFDIAQGILYAAGLAAVGPNNTVVMAPSRAQIINLSLGGPSPSSVLQSAVNAAFNAGSLIVASAGNDGLDYPSYPAAFPNVMAVSAVGQDGLLATYSNAGTYISVAAPGGDYRLDDNGGGGILGPGWNFVTGRPTYMFGYGTSASAPYVSGIAALLLAQNPSLTPTQLRSRIEQFAQRPAGTTRSDLYGWGIVNAYNSLTQTSGPPRTTYARLIDATTGAVVRSATVSSSGSFAFARVANGAYFVQAGDDESADTAIGIPGRRFGWYGAPTVINVNGSSHSVSFPLGAPMEVEPNNDAPSANLLVPGSYVVGNITPPDTRDMYRVVIATPGVYTFETSGLVGSCGMGLELDTFISLMDQSGNTVGSNNDFTSPTSRFCSRLSPTLAAGVYYLTVQGTASNGLASRGRYRVQLRAGQ